MYRNTYSCVFLHGFENFYYEICCLCFLFFICLLTIKQVFPPPFGCFYISVKTTVVILLREINMFLLPSYSLLFISPCDSIE